MGNTGNSPEVPLVRRFAPPDFFPFSGTTEHDVFFPSYSRVPIPANTMPSYVISPSTHQYSRSRSHSLPRQQQPIVYTSSHRSHGSHGSHGSHRSRHSHGSHRSHGHRHSRPRRVSFSGEYDPSRRRHHSIEPGSGVIYPPAPAYYHNTAGSPAYFIPQSNATLGNVLHRQQPMQVVDTRRHHHHHSADPVVFVSTPQ